MFSLFIEGGPLYMAILTIILILICLAAWKAPAWVKELGIIAIVFGGFTMGLGLMYAFDAIQIAGGVAMPVLCGGLKVALIPLLYGMIIYIISLIIRIVQKTRI